MSSALALKGEAREVALAEAQTVLSMAQNDTMRSRLAELVSDVDDGDVGEDSAELLESVLELGLQTGRIRAYYGPGGEQAALSTLRRLPRGRDRSDSARDVTNALQALNGQADRRGEDRGGRTRRVHDHDRSRRGRGIGAPRHERRPADESRDMSGDPRYYMACLDLRGPRLPRRRRRPCRDGEGARPARLRGAGDGGRAAGRRRSSPSAGARRAARVPAF